MADDFGISGILGSFSGIATSQGAAGWISTGIITILSTIVGGIVLLVVMEILSKGWGENISVGRVFTLMLLINVIQRFAIMGFISPYISFLPFSDILLSLIVWIGLMKLLFSGMSMKHAAITGIIGFVLGIFIIPTVTGIVMGMIPVKL